MNKKTNLIRGITILCLLPAVVCLSTGCQSAAAFTKQLDALDAAGVSAVEITGKFSHTKYVRAEAGGKVVSTFEHNNAWVPLVRLVREQPLPAAR